MSTQSSNTILCIQLWDNHILKKYVITNKLITKRLKQTKFYFKDCIILNSDLYYNVKRHMLQFEFSVIQHLLANCLLFLEFSKGNCRVLFLRKNK